MQIKADQLLALVRAHLKGEREHFLSVCCQIEAGIPGKYAQVALELRRALDRAGLQPTMVELPTGTSQLLEQRLPERRLDSLQLPEELRTQLEGVLEEHAKVEALHAAGFTPARRLLLVGPPGTGKSSTTEALASELHRPLLTVRLAAVVDSHLGETGKRLRAVLHAVRTSKVVVVLDELDAVGRVRGGSSSGAEREYQLMLNTLLQELDSGNGEGVLVATTNLPEVLDRALVRRFDRVLEYDMPTAAQSATLAHGRCFKVPGANTVDWAVVGVEAHQRKLSHAEVLSWAEYVGKAAVLSDKPLGTMDFLSNKAGEKQPTPPRRAARAIITGNV